jgi:hypothetical protein
MKIALKINGLGRFIVYEIRGISRVCIGQYAGSIDAVKTMVETKVKTPVTIIKLLKRGWY